MPTAQLKIVGDGGEIEGVEALHRREARRPDAPLDRAALSVDEFELDQAQQIARMTARRCAGLSVSR